MIEIPFYYLFGIILASFSVGVGVGYKVGNPTISQDQTRCNDLARHPDNMWKKDMLLGRTFRNGKCVNVSCPYYHASDKFCSLIKRKCSLID